MLDKNLIGIEPDFSSNSNFNPNANIGQVKFGADAPVLEVELNELQQVQNRAREDLIRSMIPSGFTKPIKIDFYHDDSNSNSMYTLEDAEAYVNGMRVFIPRGTKIDIGDSPKDKVREDLVFLEVWKEEVSPTSTLTEYGGEGQKPITNNLIDPRVGEETSRRIVNRWRIRTQQNVDFSTHLNGIRRSGEEWHPLQCYAQGGRAKPVNEIDAQNASMYYTFSLFSNNPHSSDWAQYKQYLSDYTLAVAGKLNDTTSAKDLGSVDGVAYAIPMFRLHRKPNQGFSKGDYSNISPLADATKLDNLLKNEKLSSVTTGEVECAVEGKTIYNLVTGAPTLKVNNVGKVTGKVSGDSITIKREVVGETGYIYTWLPINLSVLEFNTDYTVIFEARGKAECDDAYLNIITGSYLDDVGGARFKRKVGRNVVHFRTSEKPKKLTEQLLYIGVNNYNNNDSLPNINDEMTLENFMLIKGRLEEKDIPKYFKGFMSAGDYSVKLDKFVSWGTEIKNGTASDIANIPIKLTNPYIKVTPVDLLGKEIMDTNVAFKVFGDNNKDLGWHNCSNITYIKNYKEARQVKVFCNSVAKNNKVSGFNIYTGRNIIIKSVIGDNTESTMEIQIDEPLRSIDKNIRDLAFGDGRVCRKIEKSVLNGTEDWSSSILTSNDGKYLVFRLTNKNMARTKILSELSYVKITSDDNSKIYNKEYLGVYHGSDKSEERLYLSIAKSKISNSNLNGLKAYLKQNPITYYYTKKEGYIEPSPFKDYFDSDDYNGNITKNIECIILDKNLNWTQGDSKKGGWKEFEDTLIFYTTSFENTMVTNLGFVCDELTMLRDVVNLNGEGIGNAVWGNLPHPTIRVKKSKLKTPDMAGFKDWLEKNKVFITYVNKTPKIQKYPIEYAKVQGNLIFTNNTTAEIKCESPIRPKVVLSHKAELGLDLFAKKCFVSANSIIPPIKLEVNKQVSTTGRLELSIEKDIKKAPIKLTGRTSNNLIANGKGTFVIDKSINTSSRVYAFNLSRNIQVGKKYIVYLEVDKIESAPSGLRIYGMTPSTEGAYITVANTTGVIKFVWDTKSVNGKSIEFETVGLYSESNDFNNGSKITFSNFMLFEEGEDLDSIQGYFEGLKSFGEVGKGGLKNRLSLISHGKNIGKIDLSNENITPFEDGYRLECRQLYRLKQDIFNMKGKYKENTQYTFSYLGKLLDNANSNNYRLRITYTDGTFTDGIVHDNTYLKRVMQSNAGKTIDMISGYYGSFYGDFIVKDVMLEEGTQASPYEPFKGDRVDILLEEPLREGDTLYGDSKQVTVNRIKGEYTFTGEEKWFKPSKDGNDTMLFYMDKRDAKVGTKDIICNSLPYRRDIWEATNDLEGICVDEATNIMIRIKKSKLPSSDLEGFREWLRLNPTTVIYQLAEPKTEIINSVFNSEIHSSADFIGQVKYKRNSESALDCGAVYLSPENSSASWGKDEIRLCSYKYSYGNIQDLINIPLRIGGGYATSTEYNFKILRVISDTKVLVQNVGMGLPNNLSRTFYPSFICSTAQSEFTIDDLQKTVSLTGNDYTNLLEKLVCEHLY